jgi:rhamnosyltransferase
MSCCAVIVTFHPDSTINENIQALHKQTDEIIIIDNGSGKECKNILQKLSQQIGVTIIYNNENLGIAAALNIGIQKAKAHNHEWVITFDQDSTVTPRMIEAMLKVYETYPEKEKVASLSPRYMNRNTGVIWMSQLSRKFDNSLPYSLVDVVITSGNLVKLSVFDQVGYFNESLFIDYVDKQFCLRCITQNYRILEVNNATLLHSVGLPTKVNLFLNNSITTANHSHTRRYYIARNSIFTYKQYFSIRPLWVLNDVYRLLGNLGKGLVFENNRKKRLVAILLGFYDGFLNRMGKCTREHLF